MNRYLRLIKYLPILLLIWAVYLVRNQAIFEKYLNTLFITGEDFPPDYWKALLDSYANDTPLQYDYSSFSDLNSSTNIPPIIHFIWFKDLYETHPDHSAIPSMGSRAPELCRGHNPDFTINIWNATGARDLLEKHYSWFLPTYDGYRQPIQRVDALKYFALWHYGGVYMDLDISCRRPLTPLLEYPAWFPRASPLGVNNDLMASRAGHPVIGQMTKSLITHNWNLIFPYLTIFWTTGPQFTSDVLRAWFFDHGRGQYLPGSSKRDPDPDDYFVLPPEFYSEEHTFFGHSPGGTWYGEDVAVVLWFIDRPWLVLIIAIFCVLSCLAIAIRRARLKPARETERHLA